MFEFLDRLSFCSSLPRVRDFRGDQQAKGFDGRGNLQHLVLPSRSFSLRIDLDKVSKIINGMDIINSLHLLIQIRKLFALLSQNWDLPFTEK